MKTLSLLVLLGGCATVTLEELYEQRDVCFTQALECPELDEQIEQKEKMEQWKENAKMRCPEGFIGVCDSRWSNCGRKWSRKPIEYTCVTREELDRMFF